MNFITLLLHNQKLLISRVGQHFKQFVKEYDVDTTALKELITTEYSPTLGLLKEAIDTIYIGNYIDSTTGSVSKVAFATGSGVRGPRASCNQVMEGRSVSDEENTLHTWTQTNSGQYSITELIEKGSRLAVGNDGNGGVVYQPSLHIGVQPVPALKLSEMTQLTCILILNVIGKSYVKWRYNVLVFGSYTLFISH